MTGRERLVKLLDDFHWRNGETDEESNCLMYFMPFEAEIIADYLLKHGVKVPLSGIFENCDDCLHREMCGDYTPYDKSPCRYFKDKSKLIELPKNSDNPIDTAIQMLDAWNDSTGVFEKDSSYYYEVQGVIEEVAKFAFGSGILYSERALKEKGEMIPLDKMEPEKLMIRTSGDRGFTNPSGLIPACFFDKIFGKRKRKRKKLKERENNA